MTKKRVRVLRGPEWMDGFRAGRTDLRSDEWQRAYAEGFEAGKRSGPGSG